MPLDERNVLSDRTLELLRHLATRPGHDEVKADFRDLLHAEFGVALADLKFEQRAFFISGRLDALVGRTVFEAKRSLDREWTEVERRMPEYLSDRERECGEPVIGIASDGLKWVAVELNGDTLTRIGEHVLDPDKGEAFLAWLDGVVALRASLPPDTLTIRAELGPDSPAFRRVSRELTAAWARIGARSEHALKRQLWNDLLKQVYGRDIEDDALWIQHSYLVVVAKCIAVAVMDLRADDPARLLSGEAFTAAGISGAVESDFFDWVAADADAAALIAKLMAHVRRFRLRETRADVLKTLYEALIDRDQRHGLGEYYTPDWLAAKVVRAAVDRPLEQRVLDPACGSGTFLFHAVRAILAAADEAGVDRAAQAQDAARLVTGVDIHPVAVIIARVTVLLALGPVLAERAGPLSIPVYLGDSMQLGVVPDLAMRQRDALPPYLEIVVPPPPAGQGHVHPTANGNGREVLVFPETFCREPALFDKAIERMRRGTLANQSREMVEEALLRIVEEHLREPPEDVLERLNRRSIPRPTEEHHRAIADLGRTYETMNRLARDGRDTIWSYVARNLARPLYLASNNGWANVLVGNPPWLAFRHMSDALQKRFRELAKGEAVYVGGKFATHNDLCALFTARAASLYLRAGGRIAFVLPLAALSRGQYAKFRTGSYGNSKIAWEAAWTMDDSVQPLFPVPSCALFGRKQRLGRKVPDRVSAYSGDLPLRDAPEDVADAMLAVAHDAPAPQQGVFDAKSHYRKLFRQGATLVPRILCLVERQRSGRLGSNPAAPLVASRRGGQDKKPWRDLPGLEGPIEAEFLRPVLLGESILPYRVWRPFEAVVPVTQAGELLDAARALRRGAERLADWLQAAERLWAENRSASTSLDFSGQLDYYAKLTNQIPVPKIRVAYAASGTVPAAGIIDSSNAIIDKSLYWMSAADKCEAQYLIAILNSQTLRKAAAGYQARGQFGARHFDKVVFNLPIPRFNPDDPLHAELAAAGAKAEALAATVPIPDGAKFQRARRLVRDALREADLAQRIDDLVARLLDGG